jgi:hypothetical protein
VKRIRIGKAESDLDNASPGWIRQHVDDLRNQGQQVCVEITLHSGSVNMILSTPGCGATPGPRIEANRQEEKILALWKKERLNTDHFTTRELIDFVERIDIL